LKNEPAPPDGASGPGVGAINFDSKV